MSNPRTYDPMPQFPYRTGGYVLFAELGTGTLGTTYIGREVTQGKGQFKPVAIRKLEAQLCQRPEVVRTFLDEQRAAALLQHPRVAITHEVGALPDGSYFVTSEYVHGVALREVLRSPQFQMTPGQAIHVAMQALDALHYAHERYDLSGKSLEIVHGQISSDAVLLGFDGNAKIIEFGCLRTRNSTVANTSIPAKLQRRTVYMSPELRALTGSVAGGASGAIDRRADVYSVGVLLWELLTGEMASVEEADQRLPPPSSKRELPADLDTIVAKATAAARDERYDTALAMRLALSQVLPKLQGESSATTVLARNMTVVFRQRMVSFQEQMDVWRKFDPETLPVDDAPVLQPAWKNTGSGGPSAFQSQRLATGSQRLHVGSVRMQVGVSATGQPTDATRQRDLNSNLTEADVPIFKKPLFLALLAAGVLTIVVALAIVLRGGSSPWSIYVDSQPRGADIRLDGQSVGTTPRTLSGSTPPTPHRIEVQKSGYRSEVREVTPNPGDTVHLEVELKPEAAPTNP